MGMAPTKILKEQFTQKGKWHHDLLGVYDFLLSNEYNQT